MTAGGFRPKRRTVLVAFLHLRNLLSPGFAAEHTSVMNGNMDEECDNYDKRLQQ